MKWSEAMNDADRLEVAARRAWYRLDKSKPCPDNRIPPPDAVAGWLPEAPESVHTALAGSMGDGWRWERTRDHDSIEAVKRGTPRPVPPPTPQPGVNALFGHLAGAVSLAAPLAIVPVEAVEAVVDHWQRLAPPVVDQDNRRHQNIPGALARTRHATRADDGHPHLPFDWNGGWSLPPADEPRIEVANLPYTELESSLPTVAMNLLDFGASRGRNGPVPVPQRTGLELVLMPAPGDWRAERATVTPRHDELAAKVWPATGRYRRTMHGPLLYDAARWINDPANATWWRRHEQDRPILLVTFFAPPFAPYHATDRIGAHVVLPDGGRKVGPQFDAQLRRVLAATSYRQHRVYIAAVCLWDARATFRGHLVQLTEPVVIRNNAGYVLDTAGKMITEKGGKPSRRATHPLAVQTGERVPNPAAVNAYTWLEGHDTILVAHHRVADTLKQRNVQRERSLATLLALREPGTRKGRQDMVVVTREAVLDFEARYRSDGVLTGADLAALPPPKRPPHAELEAVRLLPTDAHFAAHQARREKLQHARRAH